MRKTWDKYDRWKSNFWWNCRKCIEFEATWSPETRSKLMSVAVKMEHIKFFRVLLGFFQTSSSAWPWQVKFTMGGGISCGASLVRRLWYLCVQIYWVTGCLIQIRSEWYSTCIYRWLPCGPLPPRTAALQTASILVFTVRWEHIYFALHQHWWQINKEKSSFYGRLWKSIQQFEGITSTVYFWNLSNGNFRIFLATLCYANKVHCVQRSSPSQY